ncbi:3-deoxy-D-arabinoheptulosonate-7-phosphate synthase [Pontibacter ummariensis]|uniref:3-deoxy-D-arabinoheptulosonate-7-phosphate synthase n=1 Tax=Pontibacter ummariensis TaxID=1610492 RepID=A0A239BX97_9BACT|nr:bifunctional 3-deoxy-7-phosphoheptulonate synthase/chorismate mutase [Pontibacter ummariensis]PRY15578.1 3-deoxy-D-arabinoheptulosonate-7-phosphate synthase [Pontibacter ummariensis]SNS12269.1 3-deoxy-D-arabinoheptulosonate-7-phosphate synthase [Pontibacter ummariensis]
MIIQLQQGIPDDAKENILSKVKGVGYKATEVKTQEGHYLVAIGKKEFDIRTIGQLKGVADIYRVSDEYKLISRKWRVEPTRIDLGDGVVVGEGQFSIMAGPCSIENERQIELVVEHLKENNVKIMRGGVFKPRSSPYAFRGLGIEGLQMFYRICRENGIKIITEVMQVSQIEEMIDYVDVFQVGARNSQNFNLLDSLGEAQKPVLLKRGISGTLEELLQASEYIFSNGNEKIMLCERGIRGYEKAYRNILDLNAVPVLKEKTHLPVIVDPSHGIGLRDYVADMALAAVMAGADGVIYETHQKPEEAFSDGQQTLNFKESERLIRRMRQAYELRESF